MGRVKAQHSPRNGRALPEVLQIILENKIEERRESQEDDGKLNRECGETGKAQTDGGSNLKIFFHKRHFTHKINKSRVIYSAFLYLYIAVSIYLHYLESLPISQRDFPIIKCAFIFDSSISNAN